MEFLILKIKNSIKNWACASYSSPPDPVGAKCAGPSAAAGCLGGAPSRLGAQGGWAGAQKKLSGQPNLSVKLGLGS